MEEKPGKAKITIYRYDPSVDERPRFEDYEIPPEGWFGMKVIDTIRYIYENCAPEVSFREPCRQRLCGACAVMVNKKVVLSCDALSEKEMMIEPIPNHKVYKDLIVEFSEKSHSNRALSKEIE